MNTKTKIELEKKELKKKMNEIEKDLDNEHLLNLNLTGAISSIYANAMKLKTENYADNEIPFELNFIIDTAYHHLHKVAETEGV